MEFKKGDKVIISDTIYGEITGNKQVLGNRVLWEVVVDGRLIKKDARNIKLIDNPQSLDDAFHSRDFNTYTTFRQLLTHLRIKGGLTNIVYSMKYGDVEFLPYQFKPVFKFLSSNEGRLLIADEVGLGKTIEALYIWKELQVRDGASRLLVVAPSMLRTKWKEDMEKHFGIDNAEIIDSSKLRETLFSASQDDRKSFIKIVSIQGIRYKEHNTKDGVKAGKKSSAAMLDELLKELEEQDKKVLDLVIFDEAHYMTNSETANFATASRLNSISKNMILLSATPVNNKELDLYNLLRLLSPSEYKSQYLFEEMFEENRFIVRLAHCFYDKCSDLGSSIEQVESIIKDIKNTRFFSSDPFFDKLRDNLEHLLSDDLLRRKTYDQIVSRYFYSNVFSRSKKKDVLKSARRAAQTINFELTPLELGIYQQCSRILAGLSKKRNDRLYSFAIYARQRELASSIPAALDRWNRIGILQEDIDDEIWDDLELFDDIDDSFEYQQTIPDLTHLSVEDIEELEKHDSKYNQFINTVRAKIKEGKKDKINEKIVVFSFFRNTLQYLHDRLTIDGVGCVMIRGGLKQEEKDSILKQFKDDPNVNVLLSSDVGAEGLDLQFSSIEINYDLPWNPMKLEQRIGRIDRIGQKSDRINIVNMVCSNTIEDKILGTLYVKINIFEESIGELDDILGKYTQEILMDLLSSDLSDEDKEIEANKKINQIYNKILSIQNLEESAGLSKAYSDSILDYVNTAEKNSRYIKKEDLINYMQDYFNTYGQGTRFVSNGDSSYTLSLSAGDRNDLMNFMRLNNLTFSRINASSILCSFPQGKMVEKGCSIDVNHPIIRWICSQTDLHMRDYNSSSKVFSIDIPSSKVDRDLFCDDVYVFYLSEFIYDGLKKKKELIYNVYAPSSKKIYSGIEAENLLSIALFSGYNTTEFSARTGNVNQEVFDDALLMCIKAAEKNTREILDELDMERESMYIRMRAKTLAYYEDRISTIENTIDELRKSGKTRTIPANQGRLNSQKILLETSLADLEKKRESDVSYEELLAGLIFLV